MKDEQEFPNRPKNWEGKERQGVSFEKHLRNQKTRMARVTWEPIPRVGKAVHTRGVYWVSEPRARDDHVQDAGHSRVPEEPCPLAPREIKTNAGRKNIYIYININTAYTPPCVGT